MGVLKKLEHTVLCLGLAYVGYQHWKEFNDSEVKGQPPVKAILTGIYIPLIYCFYHLESVFSHFEKCVYERHVRINGGSHGLWCSVLLPLCLVLSFPDKDNGKTIANSDLYSALAASANGLLFMSVFWILYALRNGSESCYRYVVYSFLSISVSSLCFINVDSRPFYLGCLVFFVFDYVVDRLLIMAPRSFTLGEAIVVAQGVSTFCISAVLIIVSKFDYKSLDISKFNRKDLPSFFQLECQQVVEFVVISLVGCGALIFSLVVFKRLRTTFGFYAMSATIATMFIFPCLSSSLNGNPLSWIVWFFTFANQRLFLLFLWVVLIAICVLIVTFRPGTSTTVVRKYFHVVIVFVYTPGLLFDHLLLFFTSTLVVGVFCLIECVRLLNIPPLGTAIQNGFKAFLDEKDLGPLVVSNIYLLIGCSLPLWLVPHFIHHDLKPTSLVPFAGVITIGIGDTVASIGGTLFGRQTWPETKKTLVGTFLSVVSQILFCYLLITFGGVDSSLSKCVVPIILTSLLESFTLQIDNLTLPLVFYFLLCSS